MTHYLLEDNSNDDDVTLTKFQNRVSALRYIEDNNITQFTLTDMVEQTGNIFGFPEDDFETFNN